MKAIYHRNDPIITGAPPAKPTYPGTFYGTAGSALFRAAAMWDELEAAGVRDILSERWAEDAVLVRTLREWLWSEALLQSKKTDGKDELDPDVANRVLRTTLRSHDKTKCRMEPPRRTHRP